MHKSSYIFFVLTTLIISMRMRLWYLVFDVTWNVYNFVLERTIGMFLEGQAQKNASKEFLASRSSHFQTLMAVKQTRQSSTQASQ